MNYRHAYHAGNFADVLKHAALVAALLHLRKKETPFAVIDTHAGDGLYDIAGRAAAKTGEAEQGILRLMDDAPLPGVLATYRELVRGFGVGRYPGSPLIAARLLRAQDRLVAIEKNAEAFVALAAALAGLKRARAVHGDGYRELTRLLPPPERRAAVLVDPPFEAEDEFIQAARSLVEAYRRFATGLYLFWYPAKSSAANAAAGELMNAGIASLLKLELEIGAIDKAPEKGRRPALRAAGLLVINPPFGFAGEMRTVLDFLAARLAQGPGAKGTVAWIAGGA